MTKELCFLFDMDGVMIDTESQYDIIWKYFSEKYNSGVEDLEQKIKGTTLPGIMEKYFSHLTQEESQSLLNELDEFENNMEFTEIPGAVDFVNHAKNEGIKVGLVTSSTDTKLQAVYKVLHFDKLFDTIVSANRIKNGKPDPECYLLAAKDMTLNPLQCIVFEDSFAGIEAGNRANMKVVGLSTTLTDDDIKDRCYMVIPNFENITISDITKK